MTCIFWTVVTTILVALGLLLYITYNLFWGGPDLTEEDLFDGLWEEDQQVSEKDKTRDD